MQHFESIVRRKYAGQDGTGSKPNVAEKMQKTEPKTSKNRHQTEAKTGQQGMRKRSKLAREFEAKTE